VDCGFLRTGCLREYLELTEVEVAGAWRELRNMELSFVFGSRDSSVGIPTGQGLTAEELGFVSQEKELQIFLLSTDSRPALGPTQPIEWVLGPLSLGWRGSGVKLIASAKDQCSYNSTHVCCSKHMNWRNHRALER
jgi:hypothetical protein